MAKWLRFLRSSSRAFSFENLGPCRGPGSRISLLDTKKGKCCTWPLVLEHCRENVPRLHVHPAPVEDGEGGGGAAVGGAPPPPQGGVEAADAAEPEDEVDVALDEVAEEAQGELLRLAEVVLEAAHQADLKGPKWEKGFFLQKLFLTWCFKWQKVFKKRSMIESCEPSDLFLWNLSSAVNNQTVAISFF